MLCRRMGRVAESSGSGAPVIVGLVEVPVGDHVLGLIHEGIAPADPHVPQDLILCSLSPPQAHLIRPQASR